MRLRRTWRSDRAGTEQHSPQDEADADVVTRDAEESLVAALQESDTAVEALHDTSTDRDQERTRRNVRIGLASLVLAVLALLVARRRS